MRVSLINTGLRSEDAIGTSIINQAQFFQQRGDSVRIYLPHPPESVPDEIEVLTRVVSLKDLLEQRDEHFVLSDLYIYHYPGRYSLVETIRGIERGTVVFYYHNVTPPELWGTEIGREWLIDGVEGIRLAHYADFCIADSPFNKQDVIDRVGYAPERIYVLPLAVDLAQFTPGERDPDLVRRYGLQGQRVLLFVGRMAGNKRIDLLIEALAQIKTQLSDVKLLLVGDPQGNPAFRPIVAATQARAAELGVEDDVVWIGRVDDLAAHMRLADVYVTASLHEGFGVPLIEAMASGVPVVASRAGAMPWVLGEAGLTCEPGSADDLAEKALAVLQDGKVRQSLVERGLERVSAFSIAYYEAGLAKILDDALAQTPVGEAHRESVPPRLGIRSEGSSEEGDQGGLMSDLLLTTLSDSMTAGSDVAMREYEVRSGVPLIGPLIVWVRRNLTSHLREPYLDPIVERQVSFNRRAAEWIARVTQMLSASRGRQQELEERIKALEAQVGQLQQQLGKDES
jgi:glycosyltransferase involved in cell wall biosynthesis